jgi:hypothetical protein
VEVLSLASLGLLLLATVVVGLRLLRLASRTRRLPELLIGIALLCLAPFGYGLMVAARVPRLWSTGVQEALIVAGLLGLTAGSSALYAFVWQVFRPRSGWARSVCYACFVGLIVSTAGDVATRFIGSFEGSGPWFWVNFVLRSLSLVWAGLESLRYWLMMRRRLVLGLSDPLTANTFLLWGLGALSAASAFAVALVTRAVTGHHVMQFAELNSLVCALSGLAAATIFLAFFPPDAYARAVRARARRRAGA